MARACVAAQARVAEAEAAATKSGRGVTGGVGGDGGGSAAEEAGEADAVANDWGIEVVADGRSGEAGREAGGGGRGSADGCGEAGREAAAAPSAAQATLPPPALGEVDDLMAQLAALGGGGS
jgi:hypothetical protein